MKKTMDYIKPTSLTWWGGILSVLLGVAGIGMPDSYAVTEFGKLVMTLLGGDAHASPGFMIAFGISVIGIRAKQERDSRKENADVYVDTERYTD